MHGGFILWYSLVALPHKFTSTKTNLELSFSFFTEIENRYIHKTTSPQISKIPQSRKIGPYEFEWLHSNYFFKDNMPQHTCLRPLWVRAEHSMYLTARILLANLIPCSRFTGDRPWEASCPIASLFSRRSILVPTNNVATLAIVLTSPILLYNVDKLYFIVSQMKSNLYFKLPVNKIMWIVCKLAKWKLKETNHHLQNSRNKTFFSTRTLQFYNVLEGKWLLSVCLQVHIQFSWKSLQTQPGNNQSQLTDILKAVIIHLKENDLVCQCQ